MPYYCQPDPTELSPALKDDLMYKYIPKNMAWVDLSIKENIVSWFVARQVIQVTFNCAVF